jgi:hypothetical protein
MFKVKLPFYEMAGEIGSDSASVNAEGTTPSDDGIAPPSESQETEGAETTSSPDSSKAFAKRLRESTEKAIAEERAKWEKETAEKYKDYELHKELSTWAQERTGADALTLKEQVEMERLQARAEQNETTPEMQRRLEALEARAARADELERERAEEAQQREQQEAAQQWEKTYYDGLNEFVKDKGLDVDAFNKFMVENRVMIDPENMTKSFEFAMKAMKFDEVERAAQEAEKKGMQKFLESKGSIPSIKGSNAQGQVSSTPPKTFAEARARALQRFQ